MYPQCPTDQTHEILYNYVFYFIFIFFTFGPITKEIISFHLYIAVVYAQGYAGYCYLVF